MTDRFFFECRDCGFDSGEAGCLSGDQRDAICPICAGDTGRDVWLTYRTATDAEIERLDKSRLK